MKQHTPEKQIVRFAFTHKTASMFAFRILKQLARNKRYCLYSRNNSPQNAHLVQPAYEGKSNILKRLLGKDRILLLGPEREYEMDEWLRQRFLEGKVANICQIRHPLDMMVSQYFSHGWIHPDTNFTDEKTRMRRRLQAGECSVFDYMKLEMNDESHFTGSYIIKKFDGLLEQGKRANTTILKYEDMYFTYGYWADRLNDALPKPLRNRNLLERLAPDFGEPAKRLASRFYDDPLEYVSEYRIGQQNHVRSAKPGDHVNFLSGDQIDMLMEVLCENPIIRQFYGNKSEKAPAGGDRSSPAV